MTMLFPPERTHLAKDEDEEHENKQEDEEDKHDEKHGFLLPFHSTAARDALREHVTTATALPDVLSRIVCEYTLQTTAVYSTLGAFAAVLGSGRVVKWGYADYGGDSSAVQGLLEDQVVQHIYSTNYAFAAVLGTGRVVTWGRADYGGDSSAVQGLLEDQVVQHIYSTGFAFAAVLGTGRVVTWGHAASGGDSDTLSWEGL